MARLALTSAIVAVSLASVGCARAEHESGLSPGRAGIAAYFTARSYTTGATAQLVVWGGLHAVTLRVLRCGFEGSDPAVDDVLTGGAVTPARRVAVRQGRLQLRVGGWPSGLYFAELRARGRVGYAVFVVRPRRLGEHRIAVVLPTNTWQAYNFRDGATWYANASVHTVELDRPFLDRGVPPHFRGYDRGFLRWLAHTHASVDFLTDDDLDRVASGGMLARAYDLIVFSGHEEYVTGHMYDVTAQYRDLGGNLAFLSANNFFYRVEHHGDTLVGRKRWRDLGRPEARLVGIQYLDWNHDRWPNAPFVAASTDRLSWFYSGSGLTDGARFGRYGIEIDTRTKDSPADIQVLARVPNVFGPGRSAEMTYYTTPRGAKVFAAGVINFGGSSSWPVVSTLLENMWRKLSVA